MLINEIFSSIDGEGSRTGFPATFIRTYGCNLRCKYCDTMYAVDPENETDKQNAFKDMTLNDIVQRCIELKNRRITFTGGEPLLQKGAAELVSLLLQSGFEVSIETNGAMDIEAFYNQLSLSEESVESLIFTLDYKTASSGEEDKMILSNLTFLRSQDVLKFVVGSKEELERMKQIVEEYNPKGQVFVSPVFGDIQPSELVDFVLENNLQEVRVQVQLHKIIYPPEMRGV